MITPLLEKVISAIPCGVERVEMFVLTDMTVDSVTSSDVNRVVGLKLKTVSVKNNMKM